MCRNNSAHSQKNDDDDEIFAKFPVHQQNASVVD